MSINPVAMIGPIFEAQSSGTSVRGEQRVVSREDGGPNRSISGTEPKREIHSPTGDPESAKLAQDEVQVQRDQGTNGEIVIRYVDHSGNLILQVPSSQVLGMMRSIGQDFEEAAARRTTAPAQSNEERGKTHGH